MDYLLRKLPSFKEQLKYKNIYLFLDFDGTLTPIRNTPEKAKLSKKTKKLLAILSKTKKFKVAIVSGRSLADIRKRVGLKNIVYAGNHGFEIKGAGIKLHPPIPAIFRRTLDKIKNELENKISTVKGALLEDKKYSLSLHFRLAKKEDIPRIKAIFNKTLFSYLINNQLTAKAGKKVLEVRPNANWDKGQVVLWLLGKQRSTLNNKAILPIYIGDDSTDEDAFKVLKKTGLTIVVGKTKKSLAQYYLYYPSEVIKLLEILLKT